MLRTYKESGLGIMPTMALMPHYKWAHVTTSGAIFTICYYNHENRSQVCLAYHCAPSQYLEQWLPHCRMSTEEYIAQGQPGFKRQAVISKSHASSCPAQYLPQGSQPAQCPCPFLAGLTPSLHCISGALLRPSTCAMTRSKEKLLQEKEQQLALSSL